MQPTHAWEKGKILIRWKEYLDSSVFTYSSKNHFKKTRSVKRQKTESPSAESATNGSLLVRGRVRVGVIGNQALLYLYSKRTEVNSCWNGSSLLPIQYRGEYGRFLMSASCVTISNSDLLSSSETRANPGIRSWKEHSSAWAWCQKAIGGMVVSISHFVFGPETEW